MTDHRQPQPTTAQLRLLRELALERGESFARPVTRAQASAEISRLKRRKRTPRADAARERRQVAVDMSARSGGAAAIRPHELTGHGSTATWSADTRPALAITHTVAHGTLVDGTTAGDGAAEILKSYGLRWAPRLQRWQLPRAAGRPVNRRLMGALIAALRVYGFEVQTPDD
jgi:hypothetical protein